MHSVLRLRPKLRPKKLVAKGAAPAALCLALVGTLSTASPAYAYLDPGAGSMLLQLLLGGVAGALVVGRLYWQRLKSFVTRRPGGGPGPAAEK